MKDRFAGKIVLVTGGSSGIGLATAKLFAEEGATVFVTGRRADHLDRAVREIGGKAVGIAGDIAKGADLDRFYSRIGREAGRLDIVVANAGSGEFVPFGSYTEEHLDATFAVNVKGTVFTVQGALSLMPDGASVVIIGSIASVQGTPAFGAYAALKAALRLTCPPIPGPSHVRLRIRWGLPNEDPDPMKKSGSCGAGGGPCGKGCLGMGGSCSRTRFHKDTYVAETLRENPGHPSRSTGCPT